MVLNKVGASLVIAALMSSVLTVAAAASITFYALASQSSVDLGTIYAVSVEKNGAFEVTLGGGLLLTFVLIVAVLTVVISFVQIKVLGEGARRQES